MPSITHESPIEIIRRHPPLAAELARRLAQVSIPGEDLVAVDLVANDASNVIPAQFTADMVTLVRDKTTGEPLLLIVIEPQGRSADEKTFSWPAYLTNLREAHKCRDAILIVVCWNETEAEKCRQAVPLGHPGFILVPIVIGPRSAPGTDDASPWLTILCTAIGAVPLDSDEARRAVLDAITGTGSNTTNRRRLTTIILATATEAARLALEALMQSTEYRSDFFDAIQAQGEAKGEARGEVKGEVRILLKILDSRSIHLTNEQLTLITSCTNPDQLDLWADRALGATSA
ncbi:MAG TPA: hypothetical protein VMU95_19865, partial [Trebonia sp.]|nr:hypothetical protein [Trebonia sp.]